MAHKIGLLPSPTVKDDNASGPANKISTKWNSTHLHRGQNEQTSGEQNRASNTEHHLLQQQQAINKPLFLNLGQLDPYIQEWTLVVLVAVAASLLMVRYTLRPSEARSSATEKHNRLQRLTRIS